MLLKINKTVLIKLVTRTVLFILIIELHFSDPAYSVVTSQEKILGR